MQTRTTDLIIFPLHAILSTPLPREDHGSRSTCSTVCW